MIFSIVEKRRRVIVFSPQYHLSDLSEHLSPVLHDAGRPEPHLADNNKVLEQASLKTEDLGMGNNPIGDQQSCPVTQ